MTKMSRMSEEEILAKLSVNLHGDRSDILANTLAIKYDYGTEPKQWRDVGSGLMCVGIDLTARTATFAVGWSGSRFTYRFDQILGCFAWEEFQEAGGTKEAIADLFD